MMSALPPKADMVHHGVRLWHKADIEETACRRIKFPTGNLDEIECALFSRERFNAASARNARTPGERRQVTASNYSYLDPVVRLTTGSAQIAV
jgi:hypothetical protein